MENKRNITLFLLVAAYLFLHYIQSHNVGPEILRFYGKDIILIPFLILGINASNDILKLNLVISLKELITTTLYCIIAFEIVFPTFGMAFEADIIDVACYIFGAILFYFAFLKSYKKQQIF